MILFISDHSNEARIEAEELSKSRGLLFGGAITSTSQVLDTSICYCASPSELGIDYVSSLLTRFQEIEFLENHRDPYVRTYQKELKAELNGLKPNVIPLDSKLNFFGDSHTFGQGHNDLEKIFPSVLSKMLGMEHNNYGLAGKSNYCIEHKMNNFLINSSNVIVQFTDIYRIHYLEPNLKPAGKAFYNVKNVLASSSAMYEDEPLFYNFQKLVTRVANRLRETNSKFLLTYSCHMKDEMDTRCNRYLTHFKEFVPQIGTHVDLADDKEHFGLESHKLWANRLYEKWSTLYGKQI